jgi:hypothetical protein
VPHPEGFSRYGAIPRGGRGLPTALPGASHGGLRRYERDRRAESPPHGAVVSTRQGISLLTLLRSTELLDRRADHFCRPPYVAAGLGPSLPLVERAGVWSLRIRRDRRLGFPAGLPHPCIVTVHQSEWTSSSGYSGFPAYSRLRTALSLMRGAAPFPAKGFLP